MSGGTLTLSGSQSLASYQSVLSTLSFQGTQAGTRNLVLTVNDGQASTSTDSIALTVDLPNHAPVAGSYGNQSAAIGQSVSLNLGMLFSDVDAGDSLSFAATGLPAGLSVNATTGVISGTAPGTAGVNHITVTATDTHGAAASVEFDLSTVIGNPLTASVVTRAGIALPGVMAHELISTTPTGSLYGFKNIAVDTNVSTGLKTLSADFFADGGGSDGSLYLTFHASSGASLQNFNLSGPITAANGWSIVTNTGVADTYGLSAIKLNAPIVADTLIGKLTVALPDTATGSSILDLSGATLGNLSAPGRELTYTKASLGASGQLSITLPDSNLALYLERGTTDYLVNGTIKPVTAADALDALKLSVGLAASQGSSWKELIAADMNHDGRVTAADALEILKTSVGINTIQPSWVFVPNDANVNPNLANMTRTTVSFKDEFNLSSITSATSATITGILVGDVNNSWVIPT